MAYSRITKIGDGVTTQFVVAFTLGYIDPSDVTARVGSEADGTGAPVYRAITFLSETLVQIAGAPAGNGIPVVFERTTEKTDTIVHFANGDVLDELNLDISFKQVMLLVHEVLDGRFASFSTDIDVGNHYLHNVATPILDGDAASKAYVDSRITLNQTFATAAANSASAAAGSAGTAAQAASEANSSKVSAQSFQASAQTARDDARTARDAAQASATAASASSGAASTSQSLAATAASAASASATAAASSNAISQAWAANPEDTAVPGSLLYSSLHYSRKAAASASAATASQANASTSATNAANSAASASADKTTTLVARQAAHSWATAPQGTPVSDGVNPDGYSAYHWAMTAAAGLGTDVASVISAFETRTLVDDAKYVVGLDVSTGFKITWGNLKLNLKAYGDGVWNPRLGYTPLNSAGDTLAGTLLFGTYGHITVTGDVYAARNDGTTGVVFLSGAGNKYLYNDGTYYNLPTQGLKVGGRVYAGGSAYLEVNGDIGGASAFTGGVLSTHIEARAVANAAAYTNNCVQNSQMAGYTTYQHPPGASSWTNSAYVITMTQRNGGDSYSFGARQPQLYVPNRGWFAAFPF